MVVHLLLLKCSMLSPFYGMWISRKTFSMANKKANLFSGEFHRLEEGLSTAGKFHDELELRPALLLDDGHERQGGHFVQDLLDVLRNEIMHGGL